MRGLVATAIALCLVATAAHAHDGEREGADWLSALRVRGRVAEEFAYRLHDPGDVSKLKTLGWLEGKYTISEAASLRVAILTLSRGDFDARLGRQQIVWGEAISTFVTDVVNPKDFREFVLPDFSEIRIPIWALAF